MCQIHVAHLLIYFGKNLKMSQIQRRTKIKKIKNTTIIDKKKIKKKEGCFLLLVRVNYLGSHISSILLNNNSGLDKISPVRTSSALAKKSK